MLVYYWTDSVGSGVAQKTNHATQVAVVFEHFTNIHIKFTSLSKEEALNQYRISVTAAS